MTAANEKLAFKVLGSASSIPDPVAVLMAANQVLTDPDVSCGVCQRAIALARENVSIKLRKMVVAQKLVLAALLLCPSCAEKRDGEIDFVLGLDRPDNSIDGSDLRAEEDRALD